MEIPDENQKPFSFAVNSRTLTVGHQERIRMLKEVERVLDVFYGSNHINWHEMCLAAKKFLEQEIAKHTQMGPGHDEKEEMIRLALHHVFGSFEKVV